jgi:hypothetical protein
MKSSFRRNALVVTATLLLAACSARDGAPAPAALPTAPSSIDEDAAAASPAPSGPVAPAASIDRESAPEDPEALPAMPRPTWLGTRILPLADDGFGQRLTTPEELIDRRLTTPAPSGTAPPPRPPSDGGFTSTISPVPAAVAVRSTWHTDCPVPLDDLRYLTVTFHGFDGLTHTGELIAHADVVDDLIGVFAELHAARFPLEEVRVITAEELSAPPTGDGNVTTAFVCRATVGGSRWSDHAFGRAIDINPFHNPYVRGDLVIPELAGSYIDRSVIRPGMVVADDVVTRAFAAIGWGWGGAWTGPATDPMHFSASGR